MYGVIHHAILMDLVWGTFKVGCKIQHIADSAKTAKVEKPAGRYPASDYTWLPGKVLEKLGVERVKKDIVSHDWPNGPEPEHHAVGWICDHPLRSVSDG